MEVDPVNLERLRTAGKREDLHGDQHGAARTRYSAGELFPPQEAVIGHFVVVALAAQVDVRPGR